jgi:heme/copper-type cytochrome/quinol oxidase subunit 3
MMIHFRNKMAISEEGSSQQQQWHVWGMGHYPKSEVVFFVQVVLIYIVVITSIVNLTLNRDEGKLWTALLSSSLGYLLPNPSLKKGPPANVPPIQH